MKRGALEVKGHVAWKAQGKAGLAFTSRVYVAEWMARTGATHQERVDKIVAELKEEGSSWTGGTDPTAAANRPSLEAELTAARADLSRLANDLASDLILVATHPEIQLLDIAIQRIDRAIATLRHGF